MIATFAFTAASNAIAEDSTSWKRLTGINIQNDGSGDQIVRITAQAAASDAVAAVIAIALVHSVLGVIGYFQATATPTARRTSLDGTAGGYVCDVSFDEGGKSFLDLMGAINDIPGGGSVNWYIGVPSLGDTTSLSVQASFNTRV